jgi:methylmalonyl-CoA mutase N-terminal domain/subunit
VGERRTDSGIPLRPVYGPADAPAEYQKQLGDPGTFPFTRGNFKGGYGDRLWTFRQYSGFGSAEESNARYRHLLESGATGLSVALDLPTQCGYDSDDPEVAEEVGRVGVAIDTLRDMEVLFQDIPLDRVSTSFTINGTAAILLAMYVVAGERQGHQPSVLRGTIQNDILKEYASRGTWIWPPRPSLRLIADSIEFCAERVPKFNAISVAGAHFRDAGASAAQEMAFTLQDGITYVEEVLARGRLTIDDFAPQVSFFFYTHGDFFEEIAKYRAGRRVWARIVRDRFHARDDRSAMFRVGCVCGGASLYGPQARNNTIRVAYEALASVLGGVQSMFTAAWDEPFALPSEESTTLALRTQQILAYETGVARVTDPLGGSYFVESLTDAMEERIQGIMANLERQGGMVGAIESGYLQSLIADEAYRRQQELESGAHSVVGVNLFATGEGDPDVQGYNMEPAARDRQLELLAETKRSREQRVVADRLRTIRQTAGDPGRNLMPHLVEAVRAYCTVGEISAELRDAWGEYSQPVVF